MDIDRPLTPVEQRRRYDAWLDAYERFCELVDDSPAGRATARAYVTLHPEQAEVIMAYAAERSADEIRRLTAGEPNPFAHRAGVVARERHLLAHLLGECGCDHG